MTDLITEHLQAKFLDIDAIVGEHEVSIIVASFLRKEKMSDNLLSFLMQKKVKKVIVIGLKCFSYPASRVSFDLPRSVGKRKETLRGSSTFRVEHVLKIQMYLEVSHA